MKERQTRNERHGHRHKQNDMIWAAFDMGGRRIDAQNWMQFDNVRSLVPTNTKCDFLIYEPGVSFSSGFCWISILFLSIFGELDQSSSCVVMASQLLSQRKSPYTPEATG